MRDGYGARVQTLGLAWSDARVWRLSINAHRAEADDVNRAGDREGRGLALRLQAMY